MKRCLSNVFLYLWQLPQNILGLCVILFTNAKHKDNYYVTYKYGWFGVSLGNYIVFGGDQNQNNILHEQGHQIQSLYLGWLYLIIIGLPSIFGNIWDRLFHKKWILSKRHKWYYSQPWEKWADNLGGVNR